MFSPNHNSISTGLRRAASPETFNSSLSSAKDDMFNPNFLQSSSARAAPTAIDDIMRGSVADSKYFSAPSNTYDFDDQTAANGSGSFYMKQSRYQTGAQLGTTNGPFQVSSSISSNINGLRDSHDALGVLGSNLKGGGSTGQMFQTSSSEAPTSHPAPGGMIVSSVGGLNATSLGVAKSAVTVSGGSTNDASSKPVGRFARLASFGLSSLFGSSKRN